MPKLLVLPLPELLEVPVRSHLLGSQNLHSSLSYSCELHFVHRVAVSLIKHSKTLVEYLLGFLDRFVRIPVVGQDGEAEVLAEASRNVIFADVGAEEVDA